MRCERLFPTPLWVFELPDDLSVSQLATTVLQLKEQDPAGIAITNQGGWHSRTDLLEHGALAPLFAWIANRCQDAFSDLGWDFSLARPRFNNAWAMVNGPGHSVRAHLHPNSLFSGVVYLQTPEAGGSLAFLDPRQGAQVLQPPLRPDHPGMLNGRIEHHPKAGTMILFPSWLWHEVDRNRSLVERVSISFNIGMQAIAKAKSQEQSGQQPPSDAKPQP